jgi:hypothetical protein
MNLGDLSNDELRAEARRRGFELHSHQFSQAAQSALRELEGLRRRIDELLTQLKSSSSESYQGGE